ncbi:MAG: hypothetical protein FWC64_06205 [Treponema sp.]|nr:hypothetical protein [Treponema sp.]
MDYIPDAEDTGTTEEMLNAARAGARLLVPKLSTRNAIRDFAGIRAASDKDDFIIKEAEGLPIL